ncbi:MAG: hypothetical protein CYPHOPRED_001564 [Cyphobasidiales sp. Tagirdzhanova-0007]|nr:MAG: hypothetical protein CYPHOPRED_001564 [Cyphobasidiales sp. Tagirdzhanova-0007]
MSTTYGPRQQSLDEKARLLGNLPLFMRELPKGELDEDAALQMQALQSLLYDGDAEERARNFKSQGNDNFRAKRYKEAVAFYTQGLGDLAPELQEETKRTLWCNRAACNLELGNYRACIRDCASVLTPSEKPVLDEDQAAHRTTNLKALFRCAKALIAIERLDDARDALARYQNDGGQIDGSVSKFQQGLHERITYRNKIKEDHLERNRRQKDCDEALSTAIQAFQFVLPKDWSPASSRNACPAEITSPHFDPDALPPTSSDKLPLSSSEWWAPPSETSLIFPVFLLRPLAMPPTRDLILSFHQDVTFGGQLDAFNAQQAHQRRNTEDETIYAVSKKGRILKVGRKLTLKNIVLAAVQKCPDGTLDGLDLVEGWCIEFYIVPKGEQEASWIREMKSRIANS